VSENIKHGELDRKEGSRIKTCSISSGSWHNFVLTSRSCGGIAARESVAASMIHSLILC
jgi:hypothetical protein